MNITTGDGFVRFLRCNKKLSYRQTGEWGALSATAHLSPATARPYHRCVGDTTLAARPRTRAVQDRGAKVQSSARQRATISGTSCHRRWPTWSTCSAVSKYQPPGHTTHQTVYCWQLCLSGCCSSSLEQPARGRHLIVITADFPALSKDSSFSTVISTPDSLTAVRPFPFYQNRPTLFPGRRS